MTIRGGRAAVPGIPARVIRWQTSSAPEASATTTVYWQARLNRYASKEGRSDRREKPARSGLLPLRTARNRATSQHLGRPTPALV